MIRRSGYKIYTKVTQYFTDDNSAVGYSHTLTQPTESFCGTNFNYEHRYNSSLANGKWRDCLYGPYTFCSGSTSSSACESGNCNQFYLDTSTITIDTVGHMGDATSNITLYTGSRLYLSSSLELAPDGYYTSGSNWYKIGNGDCCGWNDGTFISSGSCPGTGSSPQYTITLTGGGGINSTYTLGGPFVTGDVVVVRAAYSGYGGNAVNYSARADLNVHNADSSSLVSSNCVPLGSPISWNINTSITFNYNVANSTIYTEAIANNVSISNAGSTSVTLVSVNGNPVNDYDIGYSGNSGGSVC